MRIALIDEDTNYTSNLLLAIKKISDMKIDKYNSIEIFLSQNEFDDYDIVVLDEKYKNYENKGNVIFLSQFNDDKHICKYQGVNSFLKKLYEFGTETNIELNNKETVSNKIVSIYALKNDEYCMELINKMLLKISENNKCFAWDFDMFCNVEEDGGMDYSILNTCKNVFDYSNMIEKFKKVGTNLYSFYPLKNAYDYLNLNFNGYVETNKYLEKNKIKNIFNVFNGNLGSLENRIMCESKYILLIYYKNDNSRKDKIRKYIEVIKKKRKNSNVETEIIEMCFENNHKRDLEILNNMVNVLCKT